MPPPRARRGPGWGAIPQTGELDGLLYESGAQRLVKDHVPEPTVTECRQAISVAFDLLASLGVTSLTEPGLQPGGAPVRGGGRAADRLAAYAAVHEAEGLRVRVCVMLHFAAQDGISGAEDTREGLAAFARGEAFGVGGWLSAPQLKIFADGVPPSRTAWMSEPYAAGGRGSLVVRGADDDARREELLEMIAAGHAAGLQVGVHAIGDLAVDATLEGFALAARRAPRSDPRHYVIHGDVLTDDALGRMARGGAGLNAQPSIRAVTSEAMEEACGPTRARAQSSAGTAPVRGVPVAFSSDAPITFPDWRLGVLDAVTRCARGTDRVYGPGERVTVAQALRAYTVAGAWQDRAERWKGTVEVGKSADLCVPAADPLQVPVEELPDVPVTLTVAGGRITHGDA